MLTILLILSVSVLRQSSDGVNAAPLATVNSRAIDSTSCDCPIIFNTGGSLRSIWDIVWSCLLTVFACTWLAVHPNIPADGDSFWIVARRRLQVMAYAVLAPEMTILWAMRQWVGAGQLKDKYRDRGWTKTHGFFIQMGGFRLLTTPPRVLSPEEFEVLFETGQIDFPSITEEEIVDKSKGDMLAKSLVVFQTFWFIIQCIARGVQGLVITELELVTLAFAALNGVMYFFWWHKPLDVRSPVTVYLKEATESKPIVDDRYLPVQQENLRSPNSDLDGCVPEEVVNKKATKTPPPSFSGPAESSSRYSWKSDSEKQGFWLRVLFSLILRPIRAVVEPIRDMANANEADDIKDNSRVPTYYAHKFDREWEWELRILVVCTSFGVVFGSIHCIAWAFTFPSHVERMLWRTASLIVTCVPLLNALLCILYSSVSESLWTSAVEYSIAAGFVLYGLARMVLLVQAFTSLRALTPLAYETVQWTLFIPHI